VRGGEPRRRGDALRERTERRWSNRIHSLGLRLDWNLEPAGRDLAPISANLSDVMPAKAHKR
jgi:hypothetical protein